MYPAVWKQRDKKTLTRSTALLKRRESLKEGRTMLAKILEHKHSEVAIAKAERPIGQLMELAEPGTFAFHTALTNTDWALIAECKLASPVKGALCIDHTVTDLARIYTENGAAALSVLTDVHFKGSLEHLAAVRKVSSLPLLRKDFIVDAYQIYEARCTGADAILLIAGALAAAQLQEYLDIAHSLKMNCLVEVHTREELEQVLETSAQIIGINNRDLKTFATSLETTFALLPYCGDRIVISESGVSTGENALRLKQAGARGVLVGEGLVKAPDIAAKTRELSEGIRC
jgi:indole-3-glycerol phosphate synthase